MPGHSFAARVGDAELVGWVSGRADGDQPGVLLLHGGPGLSYDYLDGLADEVLVSGAGAATWPCTRR